MYLYKARIYKPVYIFISYYSVSYRRIHGGNPSRLAAIKSDMGVRGGAVRCGGSLRGVCSPYSMSAPTVKCRAPPAPPHVPNDMLFGPAASAPAQAGGDEDDEIYEV